MKHFAGKLSGTIKLESPNGNLYFVELAERYSKMVFRHGWEAFINDHHIEENDLLLFRHIENSHFEVLILDSGGCEKVFPCAGIKNIVRKRSIDYIGISNSSEHVSTESSGRTFRRSKKYCSDHSGQSVKKVMAWSSSEDSGEKFPSENQSFQVAREADYVLSRRRSLSEAQKERVHILIQKIKPEIAVFVAVMRKSSVQPQNAYLIISKEYALTHFPHESMDVILRIPDKSKQWQPRFYKRKDNDLCMLKGQWWFDFVRYNHVKEGDICLFLPTKGGQKFTFMVYILHTTCRSGSGTGTSLQRIGQCHGRSTKEMASAVDIKDESTEGYVSTDNDNHETSQEYQESDSGSPDEPLYIVSYKCRLSQSQKTIVEARVRDIRSELPIFVAIMTKSRIGDTHNGTMELGARFAAPYLPDRPQTVVLECRRKIWETKMMIRIGGRRFLRSGWARFVRDNGLQIGDICLFELKKNERKLTMEVHIISHVHFYNF